MDLKRNDFFLAITVSLIIIGAYIVPVSIFASASYSDIFLNRFFLSTLIIAIIAGTAASGLKKDEKNYAISFLFGLMNIFYIFLSGIALSLFGTEVSFNITIYIFENILILLDDIKAIIPSVPWWYYIVFLLFLTVLLQSRYLVRRISSVLNSHFNSIQSKLPVSVITAVMIAALLKNFTCFLWCDSTSEKFRDIDFSKNVIEKYQVDYCFRNRTGFSIDDNPDIVIFIFESVNAENFNREQSRYLKKGEPVLALRHFYVPVPHTSVSLYSLLTGNYGDYRGRVKPDEHEISNAIPGLLRSKGYSSYFLYSGPTYLEGLHELLEKTGFNVFNKEYFESSERGMKYKSFSWGVDDAALADESLKILEGAKGPSFFIIGFSATHSPYFNPQTFRFNRYDNDTEKGRYLNCIDYNIHLMDEMIDKFLRHNDNTIIIVLGDHGESFGDYGYLRHGFSLFNNEIMVPFYIRHPSFGGGDEIKAGTILDVYPSLCDMMGLKIPVEVNGRSFFCEDYSLNLFLSSWRDGDNKGIIAGDRKLIYIKKEDRLLELDLNDRLVEDLSADAGKRGLLKFLNSEY